MGRGLTFVERAKDAVLVGEEELFQPLDPPDVRAGAYTRQMTWHGKRAG